MPQSNVAPDAEREVELFEDFVHQYERRILNYLWHILRDKEAAYDVCQEVFVRAWQHFPKIRGYDQPQSWLFRVATNLALNHRHRMASPISATLSLDDASDPGQSDPTMRVVERDLVQHLLKQLSPKRRAALMLHEIYGFTCPEIAGLLNTTADAIRLTLFRAREQFRHLYQKAGES